MVTHDQRGGNGRDAGNGSDLRRTVAQERRRPDRLAGAAHQVAAQRHPAPVGSSGRKRGALAGYTFVQGSPRAIAQSAPLRARSESGKTCNQFALRVKAILFVMRIDSLAAEIDLLVSIDADSIESVEDMGCFVKESYAIPEHVPGRRTQKQGTLVDGEGGNSLDCD